MNSPELLLLVENCPKGAETLVTRCLHSLTDKGGPAVPPPCSPPSLFLPPASHMLGNSSWVPRRVFPIPRTDRVEAQESLLSLLP